MHSLKYLIDLLDIICNVEIENMGNLVLSIVIDPMFVKAFTVVGKITEFVQMLYCDRSIIQLLEDK